MIQYLLIILIFNRFYIMEIINNFIFVYNLYKIYNKYPNIDDYEINNLIKSIDNLGIFAIKLVQWGLTRVKIYNKNIPITLEKLEKYYEDCPTHSDSYTYKILKNEYNYDFKDRFNITLIASGSIAQVYKLTDRNTNKHFALKIIHPYLKTKLFISKCVILSLLNFYKFISGSNLIYLDLSEFFEHINTQLDFNKEYNYQNYFYNTFRNKFIVIPKPIFRTKNTLIMTYIDGIKFNDLEESLYKKTLIIQHLKIFGLNCFYKQKYIHADLHNGNWKVMYNKKLKHYQIIVYDFGLCYDSSKFNMFSLREQLSKGNVETMSTEVVDVILNKSIDRNMGQFKMYSNKFTKIMQDSNYIDTMDFTLIIPMVYKFSVDNNIKINGNVLLLLLIMVVNDNNVNKLKEKVSHTNNNLENYDYPRMLYYCDTQNLYPELREHLHNYIDKNKTKQCLFNYLDEKYAHLNSSD